MSDFESKVRIDIDAGQALATIKALQRQISDFHTSLAKGSATANLKSLQMQQSLIDTINATGQYSAQMKTVASSTQAFTTALEKNKLSMGQYFKYAGGASKSFGKFFKTEMDTIQKVAIERVKDLQTQYIKMGRDANGALRTIAVRPLALDMENLATKTQIAAQKQQLLNQLLKQGSTNLLNFGKNTQWAGRQLMVGFTIPLGILGTTAAKTFMDMEKQAIAFKRVYGDTFTASAETDAMLKQVQALASEFTKYGVAVEKTMEQAAKAAATGKMGADLLAQVTESTRLAVLGNVEQQQALETTISLTNAFGTASDELRGKINFLNAVENQTVTSIEDLTTAIPKAAPVIKQLGGNVEDLAFFLTAMREGGINASEGANALKSGLASLINPTTKATKMLEGFGINITSIVEKNKGDVKNLVIDFAKALDTLDPLNRARAIEQLFGKFQFSRLSTLFQNVIKDGSQAARVLELTKQSSAELGILAQRELNRISSSPMYKFQKAVADFKKELAPVGEEFLKAVTPLIKFGTDVLKAFNSLDGGVKQFVVNATGLIAGIGPIFLMTFGLLANGVANIIKGFTFVKNVFNKASTASTVLGETTDYMTQQQIEAAAVAASLEQVHNKLTQAFTVEAQAVTNLTTAYQKAVSAQTAFTGASSGEKKGRTRAKKYADGIFSVPGPKGAGDIVPAMLAPGEAVIPAGPAQKYRGFIKGMISGKIPGFARGIPKVGDEDLNWNELSNREIKDLVKNARSAPGAFQKEKAAMTWTTKEAEIALIRAELEKLQASENVIKRYSSIHVSHLKPAKIKRNVGGNIIEGSDFTDAANLTPDAGLINQFTEQARQAKISVKDLQPVLGKSLTAAQIQQELDKLSRGEHIAATPAGNKVMKAIAQQVQAGVIRTGPATKAIAPIVAKVAQMRESDRTAGGFLKGIGTRKFSQATIERGKKETESLFKGIYNKAKRMLSDPEYRAAQKANRKATIAETQAAVAKTKAANDEKNAAKAKSRKAKVETSNAKKTTPKPVRAKVAATPAVSSTEMVGDGIKKISGVDKNGKPYVQYWDGNKKLTNAEAQKRMSGSGARTTPKGRLRSILTGAPGKLGLAGLATMGVGAVTGDQNISSISDQLFNAAMLASFIPQGTMGKIGGRIKKSSIYQKVAGSKIGQAASRRIGMGVEEYNLFKGRAATSIATKGIMKSLPMLATGLFRVGTKFIPVVGQILMVLDIAYTMLTANARKQEEISKAIVETLSTTQERLDKVNEFFGTDAKLGGVRSATLGSGAVVGEKASLVEQFRQSEQFSALYKDQAAELKDATDQQFAITMQSLALDLYGQGVGEEQVQIIIDAIKKEAGKENVVIKFKDLKLDTETGRKNLAKSLREITTSAIREYQSDRNFLGFNWEATAKLDELSAQVAGFSSGLSQEFSKGRISVEEFNQSFAEITQSAAKLDEANPGDGLLFLKNTMMQLNPELAAGMAIISDTTMYSKAMDAAMKGAALSAELLADAASSIPEVSAAAGAYLDYLNDFQDDKNRKIRKQQKLINGLTTQQKNLAKQEGDINDLYDDRIKALERIDALNQSISDRQKGQLDLADALTQGDVFRAAQAVQQIRANEAALALQQQKNALEDQKDKKTGDLQDKQDALSGSIDSANNELQSIMEQQPKAYEPTSVGKDITKYLDTMWKYLGGIWSLTHFWLPENEKRSTFNTDMYKMAQGVFTLFPALFPTTKADGGYISGPGSGTSDSIPARLSNGEYVIRANAVKAIGTDALDKLNYADKFADGGQVGSTPSSGYIGPRPTPPFWDEDLRKYVVTQGSGDGFWQIAQRYLPEGRDMDSWWREVIAANTNPETGKFPRLYGNSKVIIPGYVPKEFRDDKIYKKMMPGKARSKYTKHGGLPTDIGGYNRTGMGGLGLSRLFANGGYVQGFAPGGPVVKTESSDPGLDWFNSFVQNLLGGGNPSSFMQNDQTKNTFVSAYNQGAKNAGIDFTDPMFYLSMMPFGGFGALGKLSKGIKGLKNFAKPKPFVRKDIIAGKSNIPSYQIGKVEKPFVFQGYGQNFSGTGKKGVNITKVTPEGLLSAALEIKPNDKKLQMMLNNFKENKIGANEEKLLDEINAAVGINENLTAPSTINTDGFALILSSLTGNKAAQKIISGRMPTLLDIIQENLARTKSGWEGADNSLSAMPSTIPVIRSSKYPFEFDKNGNIVFSPLAHYAKYSARGTQHFTLEDVVKTHLQGQWADTEDMLVTRLDEMIKANGLPDNLYTADTWWNVGPGKQLVVPKGTFSTIKSFENTKDYVKELVNRKLIQPGETPPLLAVDPDTNQILRLFKKEYTDLDREMFVNQFKTYLPEGRELEVIKNQSIQLAKKQIGINTRLYNLEQNGALAGGAWWGQDRQMEIQSLGRDLNIPGYRHVDTPAGRNEHSMINSMWHNTIGVNKMPGFESYNRLQSADMFEQIRWIARQGHYKTQSRKDKPLPLDYFRSMDFANGGLANIPKFKNGGMFRTGYAGGGLAMLHDKEFVMNAGAVKDYGVNNLKAMNNGTYNSGSVYNSYGVNINVGGSSASASDIARTVIREIKKIDAQQIRSTRV